jgi:hypothetical protein
MKPALPEISRSEGETENQFPTKRWEYSLPEVNYEDWKIFLAADHNRRVAG